MPEPIASIVIPTHARPARLRECLDALSRQTVPATDFEVLVVDDGSPEPLDDVVGPFRDRLTLRLLRQENAGPAAARNRGVAAAVAPLVAFTDDDCRPLPDWLETLIAVEREHPGALVGGSTENGLPDDVFATTSQLIIDLVYEHFNADPENAFFLTSNNILCSRERFLAMGGFDDSFAWAGAEDRDFCDRWRTAGHGIVWRSEARIEHRHAQSLASFVDLHHRYGRGARRYHANRRARGSGTIRDDLGFHRSLPGRVWRRMGRPLGFGRSLRVVGALMLWQVVNAVGFFSAAAREPRVDG